MNYSYQLVEPSLLCFLEAARGLHSLDNASEENSFAHRIFLSISKAVIIVLIPYLIWLSSSSTPVAKAPVAGYRSCFEPRFLLRLRFVFGAAEILKDGYNKYKDQCYIVRRMDTDVTVVAQKYLSELRNVRPSELSSTQANIHNVMGGYTCLNPMKANDHFVKVMTQHLNPNINAFLGIAQEELNYSFDVDMPEFEDHEWKSVDIHELLKRSVSRIAARMFVGLPYSRDETMLSITETHTLCVFTVIFILRTFPPILHPLVALLIPHRWRIRRHIGQAMDILRPILEERLSKNANGDEDRDGPGPKTFMEWMIDNGSPDQRTLLALASSQLAVTIAAVYSSSQATSHLLLFLAMSPQYIDELRQEVTDHTSDIKNINPNKLSKMEACMTETLRLEPPLLSAPQRRAMQDITLKDGTVIPKGAFVGFPCLPASVNSLTFSDPKIFRPFRVENFANPITTPTENKLAFGWGAQACPGRFFAAREVKLIAARLLMEYDIKVAPGTDRMRKVFDIEDLRVLNPKIRILMRRRIPKGDDQAWCQA